MVDTVLFLSCRYENTCLEWCGYTVTYPKTVWGTLLEVQDDVRVWICCLCSIDFREELTVSWEALSTQSLYLTHVPGVFEQHNIVRVNANRPEVLVGEKNVLRYEYNAGVAVM